MAWFSAGILTNPVIDTVLADTGALAGAGSGRIKVVLGGNVAVIAVVERRNALNTANISSQVIACAANTVFEMEIPGEAWADQERYRIRLNAGITGSTQASVFLYG